MSNTMETTSGYAMDEFTDRNLVYDLVTGAPADALAQWYGETARDVETAIDVLRGKKPVSMTGMEMEIGYTDWPVRQVDDAYQLDLETARTRVGEQFEETMEEPYEAVFVGGIETMEDVFRALTWA